MIHGMAHAKHPLVSPDRADAAADLIRERLKPEALISRGEGAGKRVVRSVPPLDMKETLDGFFKSPLQQVGIAAKRNVAAGRKPLRRRELKAMDGVEKKQGAHPVIKIVALAAELVEALG